MKKALLFLTALGLGDVVHEYRKGVTELIQVQSAVYYLKAVRGVRRMCILVLEISLFANFFLMGLMLLHAAAYMILTHGMNRDACFLLVLGLIESGVTLGSVIWFLSSGRWLRQAGRANPLLKKVLRRETT